MFDLDFHTSVKNFANNGKERRELIQQLFKTNDKTELKRLRERYEALNLARDMVIGTGLLDYIDLYGDYFDLDFDKMV
jgi:hypothetical protein